MLISILKVVTLGILFILMAKSAYHLVRGYFKESERNIQLICFIDTSLIALGAWLITALVYIRTPIMRLYSLVITFTMYTGILIAKKHLRRKE